MDGCRVDLPLFVLGEQVQDAPVLGRELDAGPHIGVPVQVLHHVLDEPAGEQEPPLAVVRAGGEVDQGPVFPPKLAREEIPVDRQPAERGPEQRQAARPVQPAPGAGNGEQRCGRPGLQQHVDADGRAEEVEQLLRPDMRQTRKHQRAPRGAQRTPLRAELVGEAADLQRQTGQAGRFVPRQVMRPVERHADAAPDKLLQKGRHVPGQRGGLLGRETDPALLPGLLQIMQETARVLLPVAPRVERIPGQRPVFGQAVGDFPEEPRLAGAMAAAERDQVEIRGEDGGPELRHLRLAPVEAPPPVHRSCSVPG